MRDKTPIEELIEHIQNADGKSIRKDILLSHLKGYVLQKEKAIQAKHKEDIKQAYKYGKTETLLEPPSKSYIDIIEIGAEQYYKEN